MLSGITDAGKGSIATSTAAAAQKAKDAVAAATQTAKDAAAAKALDTAVPGAGKLAAGLGGASSITSSVTGIFASVKTAASGIPAALTFKSDPTVSTGMRVGVWVTILGLIVGIYMWLASIRRWWPFNIHAENIVAKAEVSAGSLNAKTANAPSPVTAGTVPAALGVTSSGKTIQSVSVDQYTLLGLQPRAIKQAGFIGPIPDGLFDVASGVGQVLRSGFRFLTLQIDYLDTLRDMTKFAAPNIPTLLYRGDDGSLISGNSADLGEVAKMIANLAFRPEVPNYTEPLIIYLHILRAPSAARAADKYIAFLSSIATALNPLAPNHLGMTPLGTFNRQKQEAILVNTPLNNFNGQVIVMCNADTSSFRTTKLKIPPADDLDYWVNVRVYLNSSDDRIGISQMPPTGTTASAIVVYLSNLLKLSDDMSDSFAATSKSKFVIAMPSQLKNPEPEDLDIALNTLGVNVVPIDIFSSDIQGVQELVGEYASMTFRPKPTGLRNS